MIAGLATAAALAAAGSACAENWQTFFVIPAGNVLLDRDSLQKTSGHVLARLESTFPQPQGLSRNGAIFSYVKTIDRVDVDCRARIYINISRDLYSDDGQRALSLNEQNSPIPITEGTVQMALLKAFCS